MDIHGFLVQLRARLRRVVVIDGIAMVFVLLVAGAVFAVGIDYLWSAPAVLRFLLLIGLIAIIALSFHRRLIRPLGRRMDDRALANLAERRLPVLDGRLLTHVDGIELSENDHVFLRERLGGQTVSELVPAPVLPQRLMMAAGAMLVVMLVLVLCPQVVGDGMRRLLLPFGSTEWERKSHITGEIERPVVAEDEPVVIRLRREFGPPAPMEIGWRPLSAYGSIAESRMLSGMSGPWSQALNLNVGAYELEANSGDALPLRMKALVVRRPQLASISSKLIPPAYARLPDQTLQTLACSALPGSKLSFSIGFSLDEGRELAASAVLFNEQPLTVTHDGLQLRGGMDIKTGGTLTIQINDQDGIGMLPAPKFNLTLIEDRNPLVSMSGPKSKETVTIRARVALAVEASDDFGLASLSLEANTFAAPKAEASAAPVDEKPVKSIDAPIAGITGQKSTTRKTMVVVADLASEGERIVLKAEAKDANDVNGPGIGESSEIELRVVSESELRQELDRLLTEARDRVTQARDEVAQALANSERLVTGSRGATLSANRAGDILQQVVRRWGENQLPEDQGKPIAKADHLVEVEALKALAGAVGGSEEQARLADTHLAEAERILNGLLQEGDLTRILSSLIDRQKALGNESRDFVREHLTKPMDEAAQTRQNNLAQRQQELADQVKEVERRILGSSSQQMEEARQMVRSGTPADQLQQASQELGSKNERPQAIPRQESALKTMEALLEQLRGNDAAADLANRAGELAARQEQLVRQLESGADPKSLKDEQDKLQEDTKQLEKQLDKQPDQQKKAGAAAQAQGNASKSMSQGNSSSSAREGSAAAELLRDLQKDLDPKQQKDDKNKPEDKKSPDVLKLLKELHKLQIEILADSSVIHLRVGDGELDFAAQRDLPKIAERESDILLRLREEGLKELEQMPVAMLSMKRVETALQTASDYLAAPALGERGMRLEKIALYELKRLIDIVDNMPSPEEMEKGGGGEGEGQGQQPPFPPAAQLALLAAAQEELSLLTAANRPVDLAAMQKELGGLVELVLRGTRPNSRPALLLGRSLRAMSSAAERLGEHDRGSLTRNEQDAAVAAIRRIIAEAKGQQSQSSSASQQQNQQQQGQPKPGSGSSSGQSKGEGQGGSSPGGNAQGNQAGTGQNGETGVITGGSERGEFFHLPPERREQLKQARQQNLPPAALSIFERYLEVLENGQ